MSSTPSRSENFRPRGGHRLDSKLGSERKGPSRVDLTFLRFVSRLPK
jgi:hypothetical protein